MLPGGVGQVPADDGACLVAGGGQPPDLQRLAGREVHARQEDERELVGLLGDRRLEVLDPERRLAVRGSTTMRSTSGSSPRCAMWLVRACRSDGKSGPSARIARRRPAGRKNEVSSRWMLTVRLFIRRDLVRPGADDPCHRLAQRLVEREPRVGPGRTRHRRRGAPRRRVRLDRGARRPRLEPERLAGEIDRPASRRTTSGSGTGRGARVSGSAASRATASASSVHRRSVSGRRGLRCSFGRREGSITAMQSSPRPGRAPFRRDPPDHGRPRGLLRRDPGDHGAAPRPRRQAPRARARALAVVRPAECGAVRGPQPRSRPTVRPPARNAPTRSGSTRSGSRPGRSRWAPTRRPSPP